MQANPQGIRLHEAVFSSDDQELGRIKRIYWPDGTVEPPEVEHGLLEITAPDRPGNPEHGYFLVARPLAPDWFIPMSAIAATTDDGVSIKFTEDEAERFGWQEKPSGEL